MVTDKVSEMIVQGFRGQTRLGMGWLSDRRDEMTGNRELRQGTQDRVGVVPGVETRILGVLRENSSRRSE